MDADGHHRQEGKGVAQARVASGDVRGGVGDAGYRVDRRVELGSLLGQGATGDEAARASGDVADRGCCHHSADRAGDADGPLKRDPCQAQVVRGKRRRRILSRC